MRREITLGHVIELMRGDITRIRADAIVNAANSQLAGGGGVDGAIHRAGGASIMRELDEIRARTSGCATGNAVATGAGRLAAQFVFHAVGPIYRGGVQGEAALLASCYRNCLEMAEQRDLRSIAFPSISTGVYGYPLTAAAPIAVRAVAAHLARPGSGIELATFVLFDSRTLAAYEDALCAIETP